MRAEVVLEVATALAAVGGGSAMLLDPHGAMGLPQEMLDRLPFGSWRVPGAALTLCNGALPAAVATAELRGRAWPRRFGHVLAGTVLLSWPVTETLLFGYPVQEEPRWLRPAVAGAGLALIVLGLRRERYAATAAGPPRLSHPRRAHQSDAGSAPTRTDTPQ